MKVKIIFKWFDFWVGLFYDIKKKCLYIFPVPMVGIKITGKSIPALPENYWFRVEYSSKEYPFCMFYKEDQVGSFKTEKEAIGYAIEHNYNCHHSLGE